MSRIWRNIVPVHGQACGELILMLRCCTFRKKSARAGEEECEENNTNSSQFKPNRSSCSFGKTRGAAPIECDLEAVTRGETHSSADTRDQPDDSARGRSCIREQAGEGVGEIKTVGNVNGSKRSRQSRHRSIAPEPLDKTADVHEGRGRKQPEAISEDTECQGANEDMGGLEKALPTGVHLDPSEIFFFSDSNKKLQQLGRGGFGTVYKGMWRETPVAVKVCREREFSVPVFCKEISILHSCQHPHIVQLKGACCWKGRERMVVVTEYMEGGDLCNALGKWPELFSWYNGIGRRVALEVAKGLAFLHARNIVHFDLKSGNVLLDSTLRAKIADVGLAKRLIHYHGSTSLNTFCRTEEFGTYSWAAPEVIVGAPCTTAADIFSFGVVLFELLTTELPEGRKLRPIRVPEEGPQEAADLMRACCLTDPSARPTAEALVEILQLLQ